MYYVITFLKIFAAIVVWLLRGLGEGGCWVLDFFFFFFFDDGGDERPKGWCKS